MREERCYVDGQWIEAAGGDWLDVENPATQEVFARVPACGSADAEKAVTAARRAFDQGPYARFTAADRATALNRMCDYLEKRTDELTEMLIAEAGATRVLCQAFQVAAPLGYLRLFAERAESLENEEPAAPVEFPVPAQTTVRWLPLGVAVAITPFNFPLLLNIVKVGHALATGCTVVLKGSELTPLSAVEVARAAEYADLPPGVVNVLSGTGPALGEALITDQRVNKISFTGSVPTGARIAQAAASHFARYTLELGGKGAAIVLDDADPDLTAMAIVQASSVHSGQGCGALTRLLVPDRLHDDLVERAIAIFSGMPIGDPADPTTMVGPLISARQRDRVEAYVESGRAQGARVVTGGQRPDGFGRGYYYSPTIFDDVDNSMTIAREEIFGPVLSVIRYRDVEEAVQIANDTRYGLTGAVYSGDTDRAAEVARRLRVGTAGANVITLNPDAPYGGFGQSGVGREWGVLGFRAYQEPQTFLRAEAPSRLWA